jgi:hypothetical protein
VKPRLTEDNTIERLLFVLRKVRLINEVYIYEPELNVIHLDEKWWYLELMRRTRREFPGEDEFTHDIVGHKDHRTKFMGTAVIAHPHDGFNGRVAWINHVNERFAQRNSINRPAGTIEYETYTVTAENFYDSFVRENGVISQVIRCFPNQNVIIQIDNARPHTGEHNILRINNYCTEQNLPVRVLCQPANSPDLNMCDQSFFHSLAKQSDKLKFGCRNIADLINNVHDAWEAYDEDTLRSQWAHMYTVWNLILTYEGSNQFKNPHGGQRNAININIPTNHVMMGDHPMTLLEYDGLRAVVNNYIGAEVV